MRLVAMAATGGAAAERALRLHERVDRLGVVFHGLQASSASPLADAVARALTAKSLGAPQRARLASRLRAVLHEGVVDAADDAAALSCWSGILDDVDEGATPSAVVLPACGSWARILNFVISVQVLVAGLAAVSRSFRHLAAEPACWLGHDITLEEGHLRSSTMRGDVGWCQIFRLLPALRAARSLRVASFADILSRERAIPPLRSACRLFCPSIALLDCTFCERHRGEHVELPSPRRVTARRRPSQPKGGGVLVGTGPLPRSPCGTRCFAIRIEELRPGERLDIGVTALPPYEQFKNRAVHRQVAFAEDLLSSWVIESSGLLVGSHAGLRIRDARWNARLLCAGDVVGVKVPPSGELTLHVNGECRASWRAQIPSDVPIYPVVDLFEGAPVLRIIPHEQPRDPGS